MVAVTRTQVIRFDDSISMALVNMDNGDKAWIPYHQLFIISPLDKVVAECRKIINQNLEYVGMDEDEEGVYYMFQGAGIWFNFRERDGQARLDDYGICSDWSSVE